MTGPPIGCLGVALDICGEMAAGALASLPDAASRPLYVEVQVGQVGCQPAACRGLVVVDLDAAPPLAFDVERVGPRVAVLGPANTVRRPVQPSSPRLTQPVSAFDLGHCGIWSGIDVDGTFWDPVGAIDANHSDAINSATGTFVLTSASTATLRTAGGLILQLFRHEGPKHLPLCD